MNFPKPAKNQSDNIPYAVTVIVFTVLALSLGDALIKQMSSNFVIWQLFVVRSIIAIPCLVLFMLLTTRSSLKWPKALGWTSIRSLLLMSMWVSYYIALPNLELSIAAAAYYTLPLFITLFSAIIVGDKIKPIGWVAVLLGFCGVCLILKPKAGDFNWYVLLPVLSAILYALAMILTRTKCRTEHPLMLSLALNICFVLTGVVASMVIAMLPDESRQGFILAPWVDLERTQWLSMGLLTMAILIGSIGAAIAYQKTLFQLWVLLS